MRKILLPISLLLLFLVGIAAAGCYSTQSQFVIKPLKYPERSLDMIVPFSAGGGSDLQARTLGKLIPKYLNQHIIVINKAGGGGIVGWNELVTSKPDGYTIGIASNELLMLPMFDDLKFHYLTALEPIAQISSTPFFLVVNAESPWNTVGELVDYANLNPNKITCAHGGYGSVDYVLNENFAKLANIKVNAVPFQGGGEVIAALLGKHVQFALVNPAVAIEHLKVGKIKALASTGNAHSNNPIFAQVPTLKELGYDMSFTVWYGVASPKELPRQIKDKLSNAFAQMAEDPEFKASAETLGMQADYMPGEEFKSKWLREAKCLSKMLKETGIAEQIKLQKK